LIFFLQLYAKTDYVGYACKADKTILLRPFVLFDAITGEFCAVHIKLRTSYSGTHTKG